MSIESFACGVCGKVLSNKYTLQAHQQRLHQQHSDTDNTLLKCESVRCTYTSHYRTDLRKHEQRCSWFQADREHATRFKAYEEEIHRLRTENELLRAELTKAQEKAHELTKEALQRPTTSTTNNNQQYHTVRITNYLANHETYEKQTDPERVLAIAKKELSRYYPDGQAGVARFLDEHVIRTDEKKMILCCTDPTRYRFRYLNDDQEMVDDMRAQQFVKTVSEPVKKTAVELFQDRVGEMNDERQQMTDPMEQLRVLKEMDQHRDLAHDIIAFDDASSNHAFLNTLADRLRMPSA